MSYHSFGPQIRLPLWLWPHQHKALQELLEACNQECDACKAKPGTPQLCERCLHIRSAYSKLASITRV